MYEEWDEDVLGSGRIGRINYESGWDDAMQDCSLQYDALISVSLISIAILALLLAVHVSSFTGMQANGCARLRYARFGARLSPC